MINTIHVTFSRFLLFILIFNTCINGVTQAVTKQETIEEMILYTSLNNHFSPIPIQDTYSEKVFYNYIEKLDPNKRFFTQEDIAQLSIHKYAIDDQLEKGNQQFFESTTAIYTQRLQQITDFFPTLFENQFSFSSDLSFETDADKRTYLADQVSLKDYWQSLTKHQALTQYINLKLADVTKNSSIDYTFNSDYELQSRQKAQKDLQDYLDRLQDETYEEKLELYNDSLINVFDVHSNYFPAEKKEDFDINISGKLEGIGAVLREEDGFIKVVKVVPGSASWKQGELEAEDVILKVAQGDEPETVDIVGARVRDAVKLIRGKKGTTVRLTVKHKNGDIVEIPIVRDVVVIEETYAKHAIIKDSRFDKQFGYIYLPKFYRDFSDSKGRNTTDDVKQALLDLTADNIDGLILDLRNNEGGALVDAINTAGLFIESGPIVQIKGRSTHKRILRDKDKNIIYDGPLVILINNYSASASEILAAALQDYHRAVIVGAPSFGKGTVQTFLDLDSISSSRAALFSPLGSIKVTIQKFYRINGGSTQHKGVYPDIVLPNKFEHYDIGERYSDNALPWDTISKLNYATQNISSSVIDTLTKLSKQRQNESNEFQKLTKYIAFSEQQLADTKVSLNANKSIKKREQSKKASDAYNDSVKPFSNLITQKPEQVNFTESQLESFDQWTKTIVKDIHVNESCAILNDLVTLSTNDI